MSQVVKKEKIVGVLGGMGPESTAHFFQRIIELTPAKFDQDHIPIIIYNNPNIPDRTEAILNQGESPLPALIKGISVLQQAGVEFICIPCNTAHYYYEDLQKYSAVPVINLIEEVVLATLEESSNLERVGLLATPGTIKSRLYQNAFQPQGIAVIAPEDWILNDLGRAIHRLKGKSKEYGFIQKSAEVLIKNEIQALILGCTELSLIRSNLSISVPILDSIEILAKKIVYIASNSESL
ncbi:MAG: aspartate/glutamate racemase family protein [bacterium]